MWWLVVVIFPDVGAPSKHNAAFLHPVSFLGLRYLVFISPMNREQSKFEPICLSPLKGGTRIEALLKQKMRRIISTNSRRSLSLPLEVRRCLHMALRSKYANWVYPCRVSYTCLRVGHVWIRIGRARPQNFAHTIVSSLVRNSLDVDKITQLCRRNVTQLEPISPAFLDSFTFENDSTTCMHRATRLLYIYIYTYITCYYSMHIIFYQIYIYIYMHAMMLLFQELTKGVVFSIIFKIGLDPESV